MILIYITNPSEEKAKEIAKHLLNKKLIVCANIFPIKSMYWWKQKIEDDNEFVLICKTKDDKFEEIKKQVEEIHSYDTPCIAKIKVDVNDKFSNYLLETIG